MRSEAREAAITRGLQCLAASQLPSGEFPAEITMLWKPGGVTEPDGTPFVTALILRALDVLPASRTDSLAGPALAYLKRERTPGGLWRNWNRDATRGGRRLWQWIPADSDDTACIGGVLRRYGRAGRDHRAVLGGSHDAAGRFYTWLVLRPRLTLDPGYWRPLLRDFSVTRDLLFWFQSVARRQDVDAVVNAHVVWCLGEGPATKRAVAWLAGIIAEAREGGADRWYANGWSLYYGIARCHQSGIPGFTETIAHIASRLTTRCRPDGGFGDSVLHTAIAVSTLSLLDVAPALRRRAADLLLASQRPDGSWPSAPFYYAGERRDTFWGSAALTTAHCIEALYRTRGDD